MCRLRRENLRHAQARHGLWQPADANCWRRRSRHLNTTFVTSSTRRCQALSGAVRRWIRCRQGHHRDHRESLGARLFLQPGPVVGARIQVGRRQTLGYRPAAFRAHHHRKFRRGGRVKYQFRDYRELSRRAGGVVKLMDGHDTTGIKPVSSGFPCRSENFRNS